MKKLFTCLSKKSFTPENGSGMDREWIENGSGMDREWIGNGLAISRKLFVSILFLLLLFGVGDMWGSTYTWTMASGDLGGTTAPATPATSVSKGSPSTTWSIDWTWVNSSNKYLGWEGSGSARGIQIGKSSYGSNTVILSTSGISGTISNVTVNGAIAKDGSATIAVSVGSTGFTYSGNSTASLTTTATGYAFTGSASGTISITMTSSAEKAMYIKSISVTYSTATCSNAPTVTAGSLKGSVSSSSSATAQCSSGISNIGGSGCSLTSYGFAVGTSTGPIIGNALTGTGKTYEAGSSISASTGFEKLIDGLSEGTTYYVRPYATNGAGTAYGTEFNFTTLNEYTLTYKESDGTTGNGSGKVLENATSFTNTTAPSKTGHTLEGFYTTTDLDVKVASNTCAFVSGITNWTDGSSQYTKDDDATLYLKWTPKVCAITLDKGTSGTADGSVSYTYGNSTMTGEISHATKTGYHLNGYYTAASSGTKILNADGTLAGNNISVSTTVYTSGGNWAYDDTSLKLYAQWTIDTYDIEWEANGEDWTGSGHGSPSTSADYNTKPATIPTAPESGDCDGSKSFVGWTDKDYSHASTAPSPLFTAKASAPAITGDTKFRAVFATVSGGTGGITQSEVTTAAGSETENSYSSRTSSSASGNWTGNYAFSTQNSKKTLQINNNSDHSIISPDFGGTITQITLVYTSNTNTNKTFYIKNGDNTLCSLVATANAKEGSVTSSSISGSYSSFTITANNALYIHSISVTYGSRTDYATACCSAPTSPTNGANTASSQTVSWTDSEDADGGYIVAYAKDYSTDPGNAVYSASDDDHYTFIEVASGTKTTSIPCNAAGTYYWWVRSRCSTSDNSNCSDWVEGDDWTMNQIYLQTNSNWRQADAVFAAYYWNDDDTPKTGWSKLMPPAPSDCRTGLYTAVIPDGYGNIIFGRFNSTQTTDPTNWDKKWDKTGDLTIPNGKNVFTLPADAWSDTSNGTNDANWSAYNQYVTVSFNKNTTANGVTNPSDQCVEKSSGYATEPTISDMSYDRLGYQLNGWWTDAEGGTKIMFNSQTYASSTTLYAHWSTGTTTPIYLKATWTGDGNTWDKDDAVIIAHCYIDGTTQAQDVVMTGNSCDVYFAANAPYGTTHVSFARCKSGTSSTGADWDTDTNIFNYVTGQAIGGTNTYEITGWGSGGGSKVGTATKALSAYSVTTFTISFAANSGTGTMSADEVECDDNYTIKTNAYTRGCYAFTGWKADVDVTISDATVTAGTLITAGSTIQGITSNVTLTAQWSQYSCTVTLDKNGATTGSDQTVSATCGSEMPLTTTSSAAIAIPSKTGYTFLGYWDAKSDGNQYYEYDGSTLSSHADWDKETNSAQTLYARWEAKVDHFIDDMHGTTGYTGDGHEESGAGYTMPGPLSNEASGNECETNHYIFVGWILEAGQNEDGTIGTSSNRIYRPGETVDATNATYYAVWAEE